MIDLDEVWSAIEDESAAPGAGQIGRLLPVPGAKVYLTQSRPQRQVGFRVETHEKPGRLWKDVRSSQGLDIRVEARPGQTPALQLTELDLRFHNVFVALIRDLIRGLTVLSEHADDDRPLVLDFLAARISSWQACLKANNDGLSGERRAGLFGELSTLRLLVEAGVDRHLVVDKWTGPDNAVQDFQFSELALEVKASRQTQPVNVRITSERQLDISTHERLLLLHYGLDERSDGSGETLPQTVEMIRGLMTEDPHASLLLDEKLTTYGYLDLHAPRYADRSYSIRSIDYFDVVDKLPRIVEADLPVGIGRVSYDLSLAACEPYRLPEETARELFEGVKS